MLRNDNINRVRFDSLREFASWTTENTASSHHMTGSDRKFFGATTGEMALRYAVSGNDANVPEAQRLLDQFSASIELKSWQDEPTVAGCYPIVAEFLSGEPECMRLPQQVGAESAPLSVFIDLTCGAKIEPSQMRQRGIAVLAAVMALSAVRPISLEVGCVMGCYQSAPGLRPGENVSIVSVALDTAPLDLATTAWVLSDVAAARRMLYGASSKLHQFSGQWPELDGAYYGAVQTEAHCQRVRELLDLPGDTLYIPAVSNPDDRSSNYTEVFRNPIKWCEGIVRQFSSAQVEQ